VIGQIVALIAGRRDSRLRFVRINLNVSFAWTRRVAVTFSMQPVAANAIYQTARKAVMEKGKKAKMRILQLNLNHCEITQDLLMQTTKEFEIDVAILSEQYRNIHRQA
jgi:hypothetical protein